MPMDFLRSIAQRELPLRFEDQSSIQCAHVLRAANLIEAEIATADDPGSYRYAVVYRITHEGRAVLVRDGRDKPVA